MFLDLQACLLGNSSKLACAGEDSSWQQLKYWESQLSLVNYHHDDVSREKVMARVKQLEKSLVEAYASSTPSVRPILERILR